MKPSKNKTDELMTFDRQLQVRLPNLDDSQAGPGYESIPFRVLRDVFDTRMNQWVIRHKEWGREGGAHREKNP